MLKVRGLSKEPHSSTICIDLSMHVHDIVKREYLALGIYTLSHILNTIKSGDSISKDEPDSP